MPIYNTGEITKTPIMQAVHSIMRSSLRTFKLDTAHTPCPRATEASSDSLILDSNEQGACVEGLHI